MWVGLLMTMKCLSPYSISDGIFVKALHQLVAVEKVDNQLDALLSPHMKPSTSNREIAKLIYKLIAKVSSTPPAPPTMPRILIFTYIIYFQTFACMHFITI